MVRIKETSSGSRPNVEKNHVLITEQDKTFTRRIYSEHHQLIADEPLSVGGANMGPDPYEYLLVSLGACTSMTIRMYANRKYIELESIEITLSHARIHAEDCTECESETGFVDKIDKMIKLEGNLSDEERQRILEIADMCPVHKTLQNEILIKSMLI